VSEESVYLVQDVGSLDTGNRGVLAGELVKIVSSVGWPGHLSILVFTA
jgi:hypothetical protein